MFAMELFNILNSFEIKKKLIIIMIMIMIMIIIIMIKILGNETG